MPDQDKVELREHLAVLWRRRWTIALLALITTSAALVYSSRQTPIYESSTQILVRPVKLSPADPTTPYIDMDTETQIAGSTEVAREAQKEMNGQPLGGLAVGQPANTNTLVFTAASRYREIAQKSAAAYAGAYLKLRQQQVNDDLLAASEPLTQRIAELDQEIVAAQNRLLRTTADNARALLQIQVTSLLTQKQFLEQKLNELILPENLRVGNVLRPAGYPAKPARPNHARTGALGLVVGLLLGAGIVLFRERLDDRVHDREELESWVDAPVLAVVPRLRSWHPANGGRRGPSVFGNSEVSEAYKTLRTSFLFAAQQAGARTILVASSNPDEGKTSTTANLGLALAAAGKRVVLVSADLRKPRLHQYLGAHSDSGLTSVLSGERGLDALIWVGENVYFLDTGPLPHAPADLLGSRQMVTLLRQLQSIADFVLVDSPAMLAVADALAIAPAVDAVLLLADARQTRPKAVDEARYQLEHVGAKILGAVLNNYDAGRFNAYLHYARYSSTQKMVAADQIRPTPTATERPGATPTATEWPGAKPTATERPGATKPAEAKPAAPSEPRTIALDDASPADATRGSAVPAPESPNGGAPGQHPDERTTTGTTRRE